MNWLDRINDVPGGNALRYYLGPAYEPVNALAQFGASMLPGADMVDMADNSQRLMDYQGPMETLGDAGWLGLSALGMALPGRPGALREGVEGITAYHGSPHDFDRFDMGKIGTGEGAQAYGHGLYFAENEGVAKSYRDALSKYNASIDGKPVVDSFTDGTLAGQLVEKLGLSRGEGVEAANWLGASVRTGRPIGELVEEQIAKAAQFGDDEVARVTALGRKVEQIAPPVSPGSMYEVRINANPDDFLDWDKPLSEQSEKVRSAVEPAFGPKAASMTGQDVHKKVAGFEPMVNVARKQGADAEALMPLVFPDASPDEIARAIRTARSTEPGDRIAAATLRQMGIPGIRYLDQGSRTAGDGSRNLVVFDENLIEILRKYGMAGLLAGVTGTNALTAASGDEGERF